MNAGETAWYRGMLCESKGLLKQAVRFYTLAAKKGYIPAVRRLGQCCYDGAGMPKDNARAFEFFAYAAVHGDDYAQFSLGVLYNLGLGTERDLTQSAHWLEKAAKQNHAEAAFYLAMAYYRGEGVPEDRATAIDYIRQSAALGFHEAQYFLYLEDKTQISLLKQAAETGNHYAQLDLGTYYEAQEQPQRAAPWYEKAAETVVEARLALATYYLDGSLPKDVGRAMEYLKGCVFQKPGDKETNEDTRAYAMELLAYTYRLKGNRNAVADLANMYAQEFNVPVQDVLDDWNQKTYQ